MGSKNWAVQFNGTTLQPCYWSLYVSFLNIPVLRIKCKIKKISPLYVSLLNMPVMRIWCKIKTISPLFYLFPSDLVPKPLPRWQKDNVKNSTASALPQSSESVTRPDNTLMFHLSSTIFLLQHQTAWSPLFIPFRPASSMEEYGFFISNTDELLHVIDALNVFCIIFHASYFSYIFLLCSLSPIVLPWKTSDNWFRSRMCCMNLFL